MLPWPGNVWSRADLLRCREQTGCSAVMVASCVLRQPGLFEPSAGEVRAEGTAVEEGEAAAAAAVGWGIEYLDWVEKYPPR